MPQIKIDRIVSFSSEDPAHPANNLLSADPAKKWKCQNVGEKSLTVVFQFEKACNISKIDIGNEHSAYIEILVSRSTSEDYKVLLVMSSFMSPLEARQSQNINKVRMFTKSDLSEPERNEKWDRVKIVCTQPFNRHVQYGLSFINFYTNESTNSENESYVQKPAEVLSFGKFSVRPESPDIFLPGTLFSKRKELNKDTPTLKGAAAIREATSLAQISSPLAKKIKQNLATPKASSADVSDKAESSKPRNRNELLYNQDEEEGNEKIDKHIEKKLKEKEEEKLKREKKEKLKKEREGKIRKEKEMEKRKREKEEIKTPKKVETKERDKGETSDRHKEGNKKLDTSLSKKQKKDILGTPVNTHKRKPESSSRERTKPKRAKITKPFAKLLENVVLVISGIQNPERASLRSMALSMGAKYNPDWDDRCTHLVCAFANTPKFNQVKGKGKIVKKTWIDDCYNERKRLPWRRYALDKADLGSDSEEEIWEKENTPPPTPSTSYGQKADSESESDTDAHLREEGSDTEDRVRKIQEKLSTQNKTEVKNQNKDLPTDKHPIESSKKEEVGGKSQEKSNSPERKKVSKDSDESDTKTNSKTDIYNVETDSENDEDDTDIYKLRFIENNLLQDFFADKLFYIDIVFDKELWRKLKRYIVAYKGLIVDELDTSVEIMVTTKDNSSFLKDLFPNAICVSPDWIFECHNTGECVSMDDYIFK